MLPMMDWIMVSFPVWMPPDILHTDIGEDEIHAAPDIHSHRVGDDHVFNGDHPADRHPLSRVGVGHQAYPFMYEGQLGQMVRLLLTVFL